MNGMTQQEIDIFMAEYDAGLHPLSAADEAALKAAEPELKRRLAAIMSDFAASNEVRKSDIDQ